MHSLLNVYSALLAASSSNSKSASTGSALGSLIPILLIGVLAYFFFLRPRSQQARRQRETLQEVSVGDEVLTGAGIFGRVLDVEPDRITIETAPGTRITVVRSTIARRLTEPDEEQAEHWSQEDDDAVASDDHEAHQVHELSDPHAEDEEHHDAGEQDGADEHDPAEEEHHDAGEHDVIDEEDGGEAAAGGKSGKR